jgi:hypothetical protein
MASQVNQFFPQQAATFEKQNSVTLSQQAARNVPAEIQSDHPA